VPGLRHPSPGREPELPNPGIARITDSNAESAAAGGAYRALGYPVSLGELDLASITGTIGGTETTIFDGIPAIQLYSNESAAGLALGGMSGAAVLAGDPEAAIGVIRWNPPSEDDPTKGKAGIVYATSIFLIRNRHPVIFPKEAPSKATKWKSYVDIVMEYAYRFRGSGRIYFFAVDIAMDHELALQEYLKTGTILLHVSRILSNLPHERGTNDLDYEQLQALLDYCVANKYLTRAAGGIYKEKFEITEDGRLYVIENVLSDKKER
jgi:hypothetical protein